MLYKKLKFYGLLLLSDACLPKTVSESNCMEYILRRAKETLDTEYRTTTLQSQVLTQTQDIYSLLGDYGDGVKIFPMAFIPEAGELLYITESHIDWVDPNWESEDNSQELIEITES